MTAITGFPRDAYDFTADDVGRSLSGLVVRDSNGTPATGMIGAGPTLTAVAASWKVQVSPFVYAHTVGKATQWSGEDAPRQVDIAPASGIPSGQSRIDRIVWDPTTATLSVVTGTPATTPAAPSTTLARVGLVRVSAGDGMTISGQITPDYQYADRVTGTVTNVAPGYAVAAGSMLERDLSGMADVVLVIQRGTALATDEWMCTLPGGFRPAMNEEGAGAASVGGNAGPVFWQIRPNGGVYVFNPPAGNRRVVIRARYKAVL